MIFVPLLHYFKCKNTYSGNEYGLRYRLTPGKRSVPDPEGGEGAVKEESILTVDYWPDPWTLEMTDPALRRQEIFPLTDEGRALHARLKQRGDAVMDYAMRDLSPDERALLMSLLTRIRDSLTPP